MNDETMALERATNTVPGVRCASQYGNPNKLKSLKLKVYLVVDVGSARQSLLPFWVRPVGERSSSTAMPQAAKRCSSEYSTFDLGQ